MFDVCLPILIGMLDSSIEIQQLGRDIIVLMYVHGKQTH